MSSEPAEPSDGDRGPRLNVRLAWWFSVYLCGAILVFILTKQTSALLLFPGGLLSAAGPLLGGSWIAYTPLTAGGVLGITLCGFTYLIHLLLTLAMPSQRTFRFLMLVLIIVVVVNSFFYTWDYYRYRDSSSYLYHYYYGEP